MMKKIKIPDGFKDIGKHRQFLYGFAALWIVFYHMGTKVPAVGIWKPLSFFQQTGACGVEIFLILTGFGLHGSMKRRVGIWDFYTRRFTRLFLPTFIVMAFYNLTKHHSLMGYLGSISIFPYWFGAGVPWYVPFILTCYLFYPIIFKVQEKKPKLLWVGAFISMVAVLALDAIPNKPQPHLLRALSRIPVFLVGCALAPHFEKNRKLPGWVLLASIAITIPVMIISYRMFSLGFTYSFRAFAYLCYAIMLILLLCAIASALIRGKTGRVVYRWIAFCGGISLEIYLLFENMRNIFGRLPGFNAELYGTLKLDVAAAVCTLILAVALQALVEYMVCKFSSVRIPETDGE